MTLRFDQPTGQIFILDPLLEEARIEAPPNFGSDESIQRFVGDSVLLSLYAN
jgi:hypothetical protein